LIEDREARWMRQNLEEFGLKLMDGLVHAMPQVNSNL
jgi:hypothetical protein